jgi:pectate lyase
MRRQLRLLLASIVLCSTTIAWAQDQCKVVGWATQNGGVTGGGSATPKVVSTYADLKSALTTASVKVVHVQGTITFPNSGRITIQDQTGKTIIGLPGSKMVSIDRSKEGSGIFYIKRCNNFVMRNLTFEGTGAYDTDGNDNLTLDNCQNFWIDHCDFRDGTDGNFDIKNQSDYISVTWCKFSYAKPPIAGGSGGSNDHRYSNLIGSSDGATNDQNKLNVTFQYCWWAQGCVERMPRVRFGKVHVVNSLFNSTVSKNCIRAGYKANLLIENNVFIGVKTPIDLYQNNFTAVTARNNLFTNTSGNTSGNGTAFTPPYSLTIVPASNVQSLVTNAECGAGATLDGPDQCGCGTPANVSPKVTLIVSASSVCVGEKLTLHANATDTDGTVTKVELYNDSTLLGAANAATYSLEYTPATAGSLSIKAVATDNVGAKGASSVSTVTVAALPTASITAASNAFCEGASLVLTASGGIAYVWKNGGSMAGNSASYTAYSAGDYTVEITDTNGCSATSPVTHISVHPLPTAAINSAGDSFCEGASLVLTAGSGVSYQWFKEGTAVGAGTSYTATSEGSYTVEVTDGNGCKATSAPTLIKELPLVVWYEDSDNDGLGDASATLRSCTQPEGYVASAGDECPNDPNKFAPGNCGCNYSETSCITSVTGTTTADLHVSPVPFDDVTSITIDHNTIESVTILSASGAEVYKRTGVHSNMVRIGESLAPGLYLVVVQTTTEVIRTTIIKK